MHTLKFVSLQVFNVINKVIMAFKMVQRNIGLNARNVIDKDIKNKWVRNWLLEKDVNDDYLSDYVRNLFLDLLFPLKIVLRILKLLSNHLLLKIHCHYQKFLCLLNLQNFFREMSVL